MFSEEAADDVCAGVIRPNKDQEGEEQHWIVCSRATDSKRECQQAKHRKRQGDIAVSQKDSCAMRDRIAPFSI